jgi:hypothetical protein
MEHNLNSIILLPIFIILLVIIFRIIKDSIKFDTAASLILSVCVSVLATVALSSNLKGTVKVVLVPYAALAICILLAALITLLFKTRRKDKDRCDIFK